MKLTDTQLMLLSAASQRSDLGVVVPDRLKGAVAARVVEKLLKAGLLDVVRRSGELPEWRLDGADGVLALVVTDKGLAAIGLSPESHGRIDLTNQPAIDAKQPEGKKSGSSFTRVRAHAALRTKTKQLVALLNRKAHRSTKLEQARLATAYDPRCGHRTSQTRFCDRARSIESRKAGVSNCRGSSQS